MANSGSIEDPNSEQLGPEGEVEDSQKVVAGKAFKALKTAGGRGEEAKIAGLKVTPKQAYENLKFAYDYFRNKMGVDLKDLYFRQFPGSIVGESTAEGIEIDPILLMHPAMRLVHAIAHELAHAKGKVSSEALVEAYVKFVMRIGLVENDGITKTEKYQSAEESFYEFVQMVSDGKDVAEVVDEIYTLYYSGHYEAIYELYEERHMNGLKTKSKKDKAFEFFEKVFPELECDKKGQTVLQEVSEE